MSHTAQTQPWARLTDAAVGYDGKPVLSGLTFSLPRGRFTAMVGENGCGKTTLLKTLAGILPPVAGRVVSTHRAGGRDASCSDYPRSPDRPIAIGGCRQTDVASHEY